MNPGWMKAPALWKKGPALTDDGNTVSHVYWRNGALVDSRSVAWTMTGTVPQIGGAGRTPPGAGGYSVANRYDTTAASDPFDFAGNFTVCLVYNPNGEVGSFTRILAADNAPTSTQGWHIRHSSSRAQFWWSVGGAVVSPANTEVAGVNCLCVGYDGTNYMAKLNLGTIVSGAVAAQTPATSTATRIGGAADSGNFTASIIYEVFASSATPSDGAFAALMNSVKAWYGVNAW